MRRNALNDLIKWNNSNIRKPLIVWGARQVGKTYLVKDMFAEEYYKNSYVYVDFRKDDDTRKYCMDTVDAKKIIEYISASKNIKIDNNTLLIFDEIQECPSIITSLKYFCQDYREIPVIATGSMVRIKLKREAIRSSGKEEFLFPVGKIDQLQMYPMSFDEFLENYNKTLYDKILEAYQNRVPLETGMIGSLLAQGYDKKNAAITACEAHGLAANIIGAEAFDLTPEKLISKISEL